MFAIWGLLWLVFSFLLANFLIVPLLVWALAATGLPVIQLISDRNLPTLLIVNFLYVPITIALAYIAFRPHLRKLNISTKKLVGLARAPRASDFAVAVPAYVVYFVLALAAFVAISLLLPQSTLDQAQDLGINAPSTLSEYVLTFIMLVVLPPIFEEILLRGYVFGTLRMAIAPFASALITSTLFGLAHGQVNLFIDTFMLSLVLCYVRERTGSIWACMIIHAIKNGIAFVALYILHLG